MGNGGTEVGRDGEANLGYGVFLALAGHPLRAVSLYSGNTAFKHLRKTGDYLLVGHLQGNEGQSCKGGHPYSRTEGKTRMAKTLESNSL